MAKKNKQKAFSFNIKEETLHTMLSIVFFVLGVFFILSAFDSAGIAGRFIYGGLNTLLGVGFVLLPILSFILGVALWRVGKPHIALPTTFGAVLFFIAGLGSVELIWSEQAGGILGRLISTPLVKLFDFSATLLLLLASIVISLLFMFDARPNTSFITPLWNKLFKKKESAQTTEDASEEDGEEYAEAGSEEEFEDSDESDEETEEPDEEEESEKEVTVKVPIISNFSDNRDENTLENALQKLSFKTSGPFTAPPLSLLEKDSGKPGVGDIKANANVIRRTLQNFGIAVEMDEISIGPSVTRYSLKPAEGVKLARIVGLQSELALALAAHPVRVEAPIPGTSLVGIEIPNTTKATVGLADMLSDPAAQIPDKPLLVSLGRGISGKAIFGNLAKMPHLLIAGTTGSGKSVSVHALVLSLLFRNPPENLRLIMIDPKRVELTLYNGIPHLLSPVITDPKKALLSLKWAAKEMSRRYDVLEKHSVRDIQSYHENVLKDFEPEENIDEEIDTETHVEKMPYIVIVIDELADLMQVYPRELESAIVRLAQMSRAVGIHLVLSTQRPSVNVITGLIKANIPARVALQVASQIDSRTILDASGAEKLLGAGDMLYLSGEMSKAERLQSAYATEAEVKKVVKYLKDNSVDDVPGVMMSDTNQTDKNVLFEASLEQVEADENEDDLYEEARELVIEAGKASTSYLQRKLRIGYSRAASLIDMLEDRGVIGPSDGSRAREVYDAVASGDEDD